MDDNFVIPENILNDLCSRFIINVPEEERSDLIRIFFQIEIAHWFYLDFFCNENSELKPCGIRNFAENIFRHCSFLIQHSNQVDDILSKWKIFKHAVPTNGAIILDESLKHVLLVQGFWAKASWGFPKGKVLEEETEMKCAMREVLEETGYDITDKLRDDQFLQISINDQIIRLYIIQGVSKSTKFEPRTRHEIKELRWFAIDDLPTHKKDLRTKQTLGFTSNAFFMVIPFVKPLKQWIQSQQQQQNVQPAIVQQPQIQILKRDSSSNQNLSLKVKQTQYYNKLNNQHFDEIVRARDYQKPNSNMTTSKSNNQINLYVNSRFKPVNSSNFSSSQKQVAQNGGRRSSSYQTFKQQPSQSQPLSTQENVKLKAKKLNFDGPECWINFKFDLQAILNDLPSLP